MEIARLQGGNEGLKHLRAVLVRLVVDDPAEKVDIGVFDWLVSVEIMCLELDAVRQLWRDLRRAICNSLRQVLDNEFHAWELLG